MTLSEKIEKLPSYKPEGQFAVTIGTIKPTENGQWLSKQHVIDAVDDGGAKRELAKALFTEKPVQERATWEDIQGEVEALVGIQNDIKSTFKQIDRGCDSISLHGKPLSRQAELIQDLIGDQDGTINELEEQVETLENADQTLAAIELFHDLGFDTSRLLTNNKLDFSNPDVLYNLKNQLQRMKP